MRRANQCETITLRRRTDRQSRVARPHAIKPAHAAAVEALPLHHGDPFDRLLIEQAREEPLRLMTHDAELQRYDSSILAV